MLYYYIWQLCPLSSPFPEPANSHRPRLWWGYEICVLQPLAVLHFPLQFGSQDMNLQMYLSQLRVQPRWNWTSLLATWRLPPKDGVSSLLRGARSQTPSYDGLMWGQFKDLPESFFPLIFHVVTCHNKTDSEKRNSSAFCIHWYIGETNQCEFSLHFQHFVSE